MISENHTLKKNITFKLSYVKLLLAIVEDIDIFVIMSDLKDDWKANVPIRSSVIVIATVDRFHLRFSHISMLKEFYYIRRVLYLKSSAN